MRGRCVGVLLALFMLGVRAGTLQAKTIHVALGGSGSSPYEAWTNAAGSIHDAVAVAGDTDIVLVSNGTFLAAGTLVVSNAYTIRGVNGRESTTIARDTAAGNFQVFSLTASGAALECITIADGYGDDGGGVRMLPGTTLSNCVVRDCATPSRKLGNAVYATTARIVDTVITNCNQIGAWGTVVLDGGATIEGCTVVSNSQQQNGALFLKGSGNTARRCRIFDNRGNVYGPGGAQVDTGSRMINCLVVGNESTRGGGHAGGVKLTGGSLVHCTIADNRVTDVLNAGGGVYRTGGVVSNCILYGNTVYGLSQNYSGALSAAWSSCASELTNAAQGNVAGNPLFEDAAGRNYRLAAVSPCVDAGAPLTHITVDIDGTGRPIDGDGDTVAAHDMGAYEAADGSSLPLQVAFYGVPPVVGVTSLEVTFQAQTAGASPAIVWHGWDWDNDGTYDDIGGMLGPQSHTFGLGHHDIALLVSNAVGERALATNFDAVRVAPPNIYVATNGSHQVPFATWGAAATNLPAAMDEAVSGCTIHVSNGQYKVQGEIFLDGISLLGATGPEDVEIARDAAAGNSRVVRLYGGGDRLVNVTIADGKSSLSGGGVQMAAGTMMSNCIVRNCVLTGKGIWGNAVYATGAQIVDCVLTNCDYSQAQGIAVLDGGSTIERSAIVDCTLQTFGALYLRGSGNTARRCRIVGNTLGAYGADGVLMDDGNNLINSLIAANTGSGIASDNANRGVQVAGGRVVSCTIANNTAANSAGGGLVRTGGVVTNCIIYGNVADGIPTDYVGDVGAAWYSCAPELTAGAQGNITSDPLFSDPGGGDYSLPPSSACVDSGVDLPDVTVDIDGTKRPLDGNGDTVPVTDMGVYEGPTAVGLPLGVSLAGSPLSGVDLLAVTFQPNVFGSDTTIVWHAWDWDGDGAYDDIGGAIGDTMDHTFGIGHHSVALAVSNVSEGAATTNFDMIHVAPTDIYVATNGSHSGPFASWPDAATNLPAALEEALSGCTIHVSNGQYMVQSEVFLNGVSLLGVTGPEDVEIARDVSAGNFRVVRLHSSGDRLENVTIADGNSSGHGAGVYLSSGTTMRNCIVRDCALTGKHIWGNGAYATGGWIVDCVFTNCDYGSGQGIVVLDDGSTMEDSTIIDCFFQTFAALYLYGSGNVARRCRVLGNLANVYGTGGGRVDTGSYLASCLIADNTSSGSSDHAGGVMLTGGTLINCTIVGNAIVAGAGGVGGVYRTAGGVTNCIISGNIVNGLADDYDGALAAITYSCAPELVAGTGNTIADPLFEDAAGSDFRLQADSPCVNAGTNSAWMLTAVDLGGNPRIKIGTVDMGAYEMMPSKASVLVLR